MTPSAIIHSDIMAASAIITPLNASEILNHTLCPLLKVPSAKENSVVLIKNLHNSIITEKNNAACKAFQKLSLTPRQKSLATKMPSVHTMLRMTYMPPASPIAAINEATAIAPYIMRSDVIKRDSESPTVLGIPGYPTARLAPNG